MTRDGRTFSTNGDARYDKEDLDFVNGSCYIEDWASIDRASSAEPFTYCPIIVTSNALRVEFNIAGVREHCSSRGVVWHRFPAALKRKAGITRAQHRSLATVRDDKTGNLPVHLDIAVGIPVQCTKNVSREMKLSNGSVGQVWQIEFSDGDRVITSRDEVSGACIHHHTILPRAVYVRLRGYETVSLVRTLPCGVVPVTPFLQKGVQIQLPKRQFSVEIEQLPLVPAFSITADKCQGLTVDSMVLGPLRHYTRRSPQPTSFYVAVTRVKMMGKLYLMEKLTQDFLSYFHPSDEVVAETARLLAWGI